MPLRVVFMGTPEFSVPTLLEIIGQGHEVAAVYSQPPRPAGRGMAERRSAVHETAERFALPVRTPVSLKGEMEQAEFAALEADVAVVVAYGLILPKPILRAPREGCINIHASLLPRWRGAAPIQRAIMAGDRETGVMVMRMEEGLDTGPVCMAERTPIGRSDTAGALHDRLARLGADLAVRGLAALERGTLQCRPQDPEGVTYAAKINKDESRVDWRRPAEAVLCHVHGLSPFPGAWCEMRIGGAVERVKLLRAEIKEGAAPPGTVLPGSGIVVACGTAALELLELQRAGKRPVSAEEFRRGIQSSIEVLP